MEYPDPNKMVVDYSLILSKRTGKPVEMEGYFQSTMAQRRQCAHASVQFHRVPVYQEFLRRNTESTHSIVNKCVVQFRVCPGYEDVALLPDLRKGQVSYISSCSALATKQHTFDEEPYHEQVVKWFSREDSVQEWIAELQRIQEPKRCSSSDIDTSEMIGLSGMNAGENTAQCRSGRSGNYKRKNTTRLKRKKKRKKKRGNDKGKKSKTCTTPTSRASRRRALRKEDYEDRSTAAYTTEGTDTDITATIEAVMRCWYHWYGTDTPDLLKKHKIDADSASANSIMSDLAFHHMIPPSTLRDEVWDCIVHTWTSAGSNERAFIRDVQKTVGLHADRGLLMAGAANNHLLPSSISTLEANNRYHRGRIRNAPGCISVPGWSSPATAVGRKIPMMLFLHETFYHIVPDMAKAKVDMQPKELLSKRDILAKAQFKTEAAHLVVKIGRGTYAIKQKGKYGRLEEIEADEAWEVIDLWTRGSGYTRDELHKMKQIKIITTESCWPCHLWVHGNGCCYHTDGLRERLAEEGDKKSSSDGSGYEAEDGKDGRMVDRRRGRPVHKKNDAYKNWFTSNGLPASKNRANAFRKAVGGTMVCSFCQKDKKKAHIRYQGSAGLNQHIVKAHGAQISATHQKSPRKRGPTAVEDGSASNSGDTEEDAQRSADDFADLKPAVKRKSATRCEGCQQVFPSFRSMRVHFGKMHKRAPKRTSSFRQMDESNWNSSDLESGSSGSG
jgi:hypothetical protein